MNRTHWPIGNYTQSYLQSNSVSKPRHRAEFQRIKAFKRRRNMTYAGKPTIFMKNKREKELSVILLVALIIYLANVSITELNSLTTRKFTIINSQAVTTKVEATKQVELESKAEKQNFSAPLPVLVESPEDIMRRISKELNFEQEELLIKIAFCESSLKPLAINQNTNGSSDYGILQFNSIHNFGELPLNVEWSTKKAIEWIRAGKLSAWNSSKKCWSK
jgi:hypothetical protein